MSLTVVYYTAEFSSFQYTMTGKGTFEFYYVEPIYDRINDYLGSNHHPMTTSLSYPFQIILIGRKIKLKKMFMFLISYYSGNKFEDEANLYMIIKS